MGKVYATLTNLALVALLTTAASRAAAVETTSENFVVSATAIQGTSGTTPRMNFFGVSTVNCVSYAGKATAAGTGSIADANATWKQDQFNGTNGYYYLELDSGVTTDVVRTDAATKTLSLNNQSVSLTAGNAYRVRKHLTIADIFEKNNEAGLQAGPNSAQADNVLLQVPQTQQVLTFFYSNVPGFTGWYSDTYVAAGGVVVYPGIGLMVRSKSGRGGMVYLAGAAKEGPTLAPVYPGYNLLGTLKSQRSLKLSELNLYTGDPTTGVAAGPNSATGDILILLHPDGTSATYFYSNVTGFTGWYDTTYTASANVLVAPSSVFFLQRKAPRLAFYWTIPAE